MKVKKQQALALFLACVPVPKIAEQTNLSVNTVRKWVDRGQWGKSRSQTVNLIKGRMQAGVMLQAANSLGDEVRSDLAEVLRNQAKTLRNQPVKRVGQLAGRDGMATAAKTVVDAAATIFGWSESRVIGLVDVRQLSADHSSEQAVIDVQATEMPAESPENVTEVIQSESTQSASPTTETT